TGFTTDLFVRVADTFAQVGFRWTPATNNRSNLSHDFFINPVNMNDAPTRFFRHIKARIFIGRFDDDRVGKPNSEGNIISLQIGLITHTFNFESLTEARANPNYHIIEQGTGETVQCAMVA